MKEYGKTLMNALEELKLILPQMLEDAKIVPFLNIHDDGEQKN